MKNRLHPDLKKIMTRNKTPVQLQTRVKGNEHNSTMKADENRKEAYRKCLEEGKNQGTIAKEMGVTQATVSGWINHEYEATKIANSNAAAIVREQNKERYEKLINRFMPLAIHEALDVSGDETGRNGEIKHVEMEQWRASIEAARIVSDNVSKLSKIYGLEKVSIDLPKGGNLIFNNGSMFMSVRGLADKMLTDKQPETIEGEFQQLEQ